MPAAFPVRSSPLFRFIIPTIAALMLSAAHPLAARELPGIDRLGDAPAPSSLKRSADESIRMHAQLGVPTFVWAQSPGVTGLKSALTPEVDSRAVSDPVATARGHLRRLGPLYGLPESRVDPLPVQYSQTLKNGGAVVKFRNRIDGVEVFREEAAVLLGNDGALVAVGGFVTGGNSDGVFNVPLPDAIGVALRDWSFGEGMHQSLRPEGSRDGYEYFALPREIVSADGSRVRSAIRAKPVLFRMPGRLLPAYYIEVEVDDGVEPGVVDSYAYVIDATTKAVLYRRDQTSNAAFSYRVFAESGGNNLPFPSPAGRNGWPHPTGTPDGFQGPMVAPNLVTLQNAAFSRNDPWLAANATVTTGNNVDAFANLTSPDGFNSGDVRATVTAATTFDRTYNNALQPGASSAQVMSSVTSLFYVNNFLHDWFYDAGFDEASGNAQTSNFGRGGLGNDAIIAEAQDYSGRNNANMSTPADGSRPRMRMYVFNGTQTLTATVNSPVLYAGPKTTAGAQFGPAAFNLTDDVADAVDANPDSTLAAQACSAIVSNVAGKIALIDRGNCSFKTKVINAQIAGAVGVLIANNTSGIQGMGDDTAIATTVIIPSVMITQADGAVFREKLPSPGINITLVSIPAIDRDGTIDNTIVAHEWGHYISSRLVANSNGLTTQMADGMGEGWADFHALLLLVKGSDAVLPANAGFNGLYTIGAYVLGGAGANNNSYYYGIRRYPYSRDMTKNPLTFKHVANGATLPSSPAPRFGADGGANAEVHNTGEVWATMLWECYSNLLNDTARLTFDQAQDRMKRYLVTGYKMTPVSPTFLEARDALLAAMAAQDSSDYALCLRGFAKRGAGAGAVSADRFSLTNAGTVESYIAGGALSIVSATITDGALSCDTDGIVDNGETGTLSITIRNMGATPLNATTGSVSSPNTHLTFPSGPGFTYPTVAPGQQATVTVAVRVLGAPAKETATINIIVDDPTLSIAHPVSFPITFLVNADAKAAQSKTDTVETPNTVWTTGNSIASTGNGYLWHRTTISAIDHRWLGPDAAVPQLTWLQSPPLNVAASGNFSFTFRHRFRFEFDGDDNYDGGQIQISTNGGSTWTDIGASASPGYTGAFATYTGNENPYAGLRGYVKQNASWPSLETVTVNLGPAYAGQTVRVRFVIATDDGTAGPGWEIDDIAFSNINNTPFDAYVDHTAACPVVTAPSAPSIDVDGDGRYDALTDGMLIVRYLFGVTGNALTIGAIAAGAARSTPAAIVQYLDGIRTLLDVDVNGQPDALTDGMLILRYLFGFRGTALTSIALGTGATLAAPGIEANIRALMP